MRVTSPKELKTKLSRKRAKKAKLCALSAKMERLPGARDVLPDFKEIYYQPVDPEAEKRELEAQVLRRRALAGKDKETYGFHGTAEVADQPVIRYDAGDFPTQGLREAGVPKVKAPKLVVSSSGKLSLRRRT